MDSAYTGNFNDRALLGGFLFVLINGYQNPIVTFHDTVVKNPLDSQDAYICTTNEPIQIDEFIADIQLFVNNISIAGFPATKFGFYEKIPDKLGFYVGSECSGILHSSGQSIDAGCTATDIVKSINTNPLEWFNDFQAHCITYSAACFAGGLGLATTFRDSYATFLALNTFVIGYEQESLDRDQIGNLALVQKYKNDIQACVNSTLKQVATDQEVTNFLQGIFDPMSILTRIDSCLVQQRLKLLANVGKFITVPDYYKTYKIQVKNFELYVDRNQIFNLPVQFTCTFIETQTATDIWLYAITFTGGFLSIGIVSVLLISSVLTYFLNPDAPRNVPKQDRVWGML